MTKRDAVRRTRAADRRDPVTPRHHRDSRARCFRNRSAPRGLRVRALQIFHRLDPVGRPVISLASCASPARSTRDDGGLLPMPGSRCSPCCRGHCRAAGIRGTADRRTLTAGRSAATCRTSAGGSLSHAAHRGTARGNADLRPQPGQPARLADAANGWQRGRKRADELRR